MNADLTARLLIAARCCDALEPCASCRTKRAHYFSERRREEREGVRIPAPRDSMSALRMRLLSA